MLRSEGLLFVVLLASAAPSWAQAPEILSHQGHLLMPGGASAPDGTYGIRFGIFPSATGGTPLFERELAVRVQSGTYHVLLSGTPGVLQHALDGAPRFLELTIVSGPVAVAPAVLSPRQEVGAVPFARFARRASRADTIVGAGAPAGSILPPGAVLLSAEASCPPGFEILDGTHQAGGPAHDMRGRFPLGSDTPGTAGGSSTHRHKGKSDPIALPSPAFSGMASGSSGSVVRSDHHHNSSSQPDYYSDDQPNRPPFATVTFCRKI